MTASSQAPLTRLLRSKEVKVVKTPNRAPKANAFAERWVRTAREDCLDQLLITGRGHLERTMSDYVAHYNAERPHRSLAPCVERWRAARGELSER